MTVPENQFTLSIIIPVYNVEAYLKTCLDSIYSQISIQPSLKKTIEVLCIDDKSTDKSHQTLTSYKHISGQPKILRHSLNKGLGATRNTGLKQAAGQYILFLDSDDWLKISALESLLKYLENSNHVDVIHCRYERHFSHGKIETSPFVDINQQTQDIIKEASILEPKYAWSRIVKRSLILNNSLSFYNNYYEDISWSLRCSYYAKSIVFLDCPIVCYRERENSILKTRSEKHLQIFNEYKAIYSLFCNTTLEQAFKISLTNDAYNIFKNRQQRIPEIKYKEFLIELFSILNQVNGKLPLKPFIKLLILRAHHWKQHFFHFLISKKHSK